MSRPVRPVDEITVQGDTEWLLEFIDKKLSRHTQHVGHLDTSAVDAHPVQSVAGVIYGQTGHLPHVFADDCASTFAVERCTFYAWTAADGVAPVNVPVISCTNWQREFR